MSGATWKTAKRFVVCAISSATVLVAVIAAYGQDAKPDQVQVAAALDAWNGIVTVLQHPRCLNCHQKDYPLQGGELKVGAPRHGEKPRVHIPLVVRQSPDGIGEGVAAMRCSACHSANGNNESPGAPGANGKAWGLAPKVMSWQGLSSADICGMIQDPVRNKSPITGKPRSGEDLVGHMQEEELVRWAWNPGGDREAPPIPADDFVKLMKTWVKGGMPCPK